MEPAEIHAPEDSPLLAPCAAPEDAVVSQAAPLDATDSADASALSVEAGTAVVAPQSFSKPRLTLTASGSAFAPLPQLSPPRGAAHNKQLLFIKTSDSPSSLLSERTRHQHTRKVTRDIAALDFLQNIPMKSESLALHHAPGGSPHRNYGGRAQPSPPRVAFQIKRTDAVAARDGDDTLPSDTPSNSGDNYERGDEGLAGRRLPGFEAKIVGLPPLFRYRMTTRFPAASAVVRRWESMTNQQGLLDSRVFFSRGCGYPIAASTLIKYNGNDKTATPHHLGARKRFLSVNTMEPQSYDWRGKSYYRLLHATWAPCDRDRDSQDDHPAGSLYVANYLDDPEFRQGRHRHVVRGDKNIGPVVSSILLFVKPHELKEVCWWICHVFGIIRHIFMLYFYVGTEQEVSGKARMAPGQRALAQQDSQSQARDADHGPAAPHGSRDHRAGMRLL
jgi:hypothetical protein